jgi:hypothetical protein
MEIEAKAQVRITEADLQRYIDVNNLPEWCGAIEEVVSHQGSRGERFLQREQLSRPLKPAIL